MPRMAQPSYVDACDAEDDDGAVYRAMATCGPAQTDVSNGGPSNNFHILLPSLCIVLLLELAFCLH
jgi:hypothetical protein